MSKQNKRTNQFSKKKKIAFKVFTLLFSIFLLVIFELLLRLFTYGDNLSLFVEHPHAKYDNYYITNPKIGEKYFSAFEATGGTNDAFLKKKPDNGFRVIVMGSSTVVGFPYNRNLMFTRILQKRLQDAYPEKHIEVINTAITAINSITLNDYMSDIIEQEPDAILFYAGHNEFYGAFGVGSNETMSKNTFLRNFHFKFINLRTYQLIRSIIQKVSKATVKQNDIANQKGSLMKRIVKDKDIVFGGELYQVGIKQYQENLNSILLTAQKEDIPVFIGDLVSNVKDIPPFGDTPEAHEAYQNAQAAFISGDTITARELFYTAKDLDPVRFRASEDINTIITELSDKYKCHFVPVKKQFSANSKGNIVGNNLLTEHVHPNIEGQFLMADAFFTGISKSNLIAENNIHSKPGSFYRNNWSYSNLDSIIAEFRVLQLKSYWPFTSLNNDITFIETFSPKSTLDSIAFSAIVNPLINEETIHDSLANAYFEKKDFSNALKEYEILSTIAPYWYKYLNQAASCNLKLNDLHKAEEYLTLSQEYAPSFFSHLMLGEINTFKLNMGLAELHYQEALKLSDNNVDEKAIALESLYKLYKQIGDNKNRANTEKKLLKLNKPLPDYSEKAVFKYADFTPSNIAELIYKAENIKQSNIDSALHYYSQALLINDCPLVHKLIGDQLYLKKDNRLLYHYSKAYDAYRYHPPFLVTYCIAKYVNKDIAGAKETLAQLKQLEPNNSEIHKLEQILSSK